MCKIISLSARRILSQDSIQYYMGLELQSRFSHNLVIAQRIRELKPKYDKQRHLERIIKRMG